MYKEFSVFGFYVVFFVPPSRHEEHNEPRSAQRFLAFFAMFLCVLCGSFFYRKERRVFAERRKELKLVKKGATN
jgi:hypothetical protein